MKGETEMFGYVDTLPGKISATRATWHGQLVKARWVGDEILTTACPGGSGRLRPAVFVGKSAGASKYDPDSMTCRALSVPPHDAVRQKTPCFSVYLPFPAATALDYVKLARLNVAGGNIRNIALAATFFAADARTPVQMAHLLRATHLEAAKREKSPSDAETGGWT